MNNPEEELKRMRKFAMTSCFLCSSRYPFMGGGLEVEYHGLARCFFCQDCIDSVYLSNSKVEEIPYDFWLSLIYGSAIDYAGTIKLGETHE